MQRRLAAILAADVAGYSRLMGMDEASTLSSLKSHMADVIVPSISDRHGRVVKLMGDGVLAEFASALDAVTAAIEIQRSLSNLNQPVPVERQIWLRIGVNLGDVVSDGDDIFGDGINVAARLQEYAEPGGICISAMVHLQVRNHLTIKFEDLGERRLKNIVYPVRVIRLLTGPKPGGGSYRLGALRSRGAIGVVTVFGALIVLGVVILRATLGAGPTEATRSESDYDASGAPHAPSIAILPFTNLSGHQDQEYFADGMAEDLITDLSKISGLLVISRNSSFAFKHRTVDVQSIARELGVRYVLEGSVRRAGDEVRINAQLIDARTGGHLWAERYDGRVTAVFELQDRVTAKIVEALAVELTPQEAKRLGDVGTENVEAHDAYLIGLSYYYRRTPEAFAAARRHFERAVEIDPGYSAAHAALAKIYGQIDSIPFGRALFVPLNDAPAMAREALNRAGSVELADTHVVRSWLALDKFQHDLAMSEAEIARDLSPNDIDAIEALAEARIYAGQFDEGIELAERAMLQNPSLVARPLQLIGLAEFAKGRPKLAIEHIERGYELGSEETVYAGVLTAAYGEVGDAERAAKSFAIFRNGFLEEPDLARSVAVFRLLDPAVTDRLARGFEAAGAKVWFTREDGGYLALVRENRLSSREIGSALAGGYVEGGDFWRTFEWRRRGTATGAIVYSGFPIQSGIPRGLEGTSRLHDDMLCEAWAERVDLGELCAVMFHVRGEKAQKRWGNFIMYTDTGPHYIKSK